MEILTLLEILKEIKEKIIDVKIYFDSFLTFYNAIKEKILLILLEIMMEIKGNKQT